MGEAIEIGNLPEYHQKGILLKKELPEIQNQYHVPWQGILRPAIKAKDSEKVLEAFLKMQEKQSPLALVENEDGQFVGILTIEDFIEEVVGDINDKSDYSHATKVLSNRPKINLKKLEM